MKKQNNHFWLIIYLGVSHVFIVLLLAILLSVEHFFAIIFALFLFISLLFVPILLYGKSYIKYYLIVVCLFVPVVFNWSIWENTWKYKNYSLECVDPCSQYNMNIFNLLTENELIFSALRFSNWFGIDFWSLSVDNKIFSQINNQTINLPSGIQKWLTNNTKNTQYYLQYGENYKAGNKVIFLLHWNGGWFLFYQKYFSKLIKNNDYLMVSPNYWMWLRDRKEGMKKILATKNDLINKWIIRKDSEFILMWISNGWRGLSRVIDSSEYNIFKKYIYLSWFIDTEIMLSDNFNKNISNKELLLIHWEKDKRAVFSKEVFEKISDKSEQLIYKEWTHFILLDNYSEIINTIQKFIKK